MDLQHVVEQLLAAVNLYWVDLRPGTGFNMESCLNICNFIIITRKSLWDSYILYILAFPPGLAALVQGYVPGGGGRLITSKPLLGAAILLCPLFIYLRIFLRDACRED